MLQTLNPLVSDVEKIVSKLCKDKSPSHNDLLNLETFITKQSIALAINETFFPTSSTQNLIVTGAKTNHILPSVSNLEVCSKFFYRLFP